MNSFPWDHEYDEKGVHRSLSNATGEVRDLVKAVLNRAWQEGSIGEERRALLVGEYVERLVKSGHIEASGITEKTLTDKGRKLLSSLDKYVQAQRALEGRARGAKEGGAS